jgi:hypothetical protein
VKFLILLIFFVITLVTLPFTTASLPGQITFTILASAILLTALYVISHSKNTLYLGIALALPAIVADWFDLIHTAVWISICSDIFTFLFFLFTIFIIVRTIFFQNRISADTLYGAICIYLLIGFAFAQLYSLIETLSPGAFTGSPTETFTTFQEVAQQMRNAVYYSFVTLTTLGYGDITPLTMHGKFLAILEAITGQLFIATAIARTVLIKQK